MRVLIHNSDSPHNRGDRAILAGNVELARHRWPDAEVVALSQYPERDASWFGIRFLPVSPTARASATCSACSERRAVRTSCSGAAARS